MKRITIIISLLFTLTVCAQTTAIKGKIINNNTIPLNGANIIIEGTNKSSETDENGLFQIGNLKSGNYFLKISLLGYKTKKVQISTNTKDLQIITLMPENTTLEEVVVNSLKKSKKPSTSLRLKTPIKQLPQNIQVVSNELLENQMVTNILEGAFRNVSGVSNIEHWGHFAKIHMRGFRLPAFRNGVNIQDPWGPLSEDMFMIDRIEFVKGPSGFMMAAGEPGGFYNVVTKKPTAKRIANLSFIAGTQDTYRSAIDFGGKIGGSERFLYRLNAMYQSAGSHRKFEKTNRFGIAPSLAYKITDKTTFLAEYSYQEAESFIGGAYVFAPTSKGYGSLDRNFSMIDSNFPKTNIREVSLLNRLTHEFDDNWSIEAKYAMMDYNQKGASMWTESMKENGDAFRNFNIWDAISEGNYLQLYLNGKFDTATISNTILGGLDYTDKTYWADFSQSDSMDKEKPFNIYNPTYGDRNYLVFDRSVSLKKRESKNTYVTDIKSLYLQDELAFLQNRVRLTLAARYTELLFERKFGKRPKTKKTANKITPRIGVSIDLIPQLTLYGLYDQSFLASNLSNPKPGTNERPVEGTIYEGGLKSNFLNDKIKASLSGYLITKNNLASIDPKHINPKTKKPYNIQIGEVQSKGFEFDVQGQLTKELHILLNYANTNIEITKDNDPKKIGRKIDGYATHITNGWLNYTFDKNSILKGFGLSLGYQYQVDRTTWDWGAKHKTPLPNYFRMDGAVTWSTKKFKMGLNINNILNEYLYSGANYSDFLYWQSEPGINGRLSLVLNL